MRGGSVVGTGGSLGAEAAAIGFMAIPFDAETSRNQRREGQEQKENIMPLSRGQLKRRIDGTLSREE